MPGSERAASLASVSRSEEPLWEAAFPGGGDVGDRRHGMRVTAR